MGVEKVIGNIDTFPLRGRDVEKVWIEWYELDKKLMRKQTEMAEPVGIRVGEHLHKGDVLYEDRNRVVVLDVLPCELVSVSVSTMEEMGRLCFELGNRHLSLSIEEHQVRVPYDEPTYLYLKKLGFNAEKVTDYFTHFTVCHAHGHEHSHDHEHSHTHEHSHKH